MHDPVADMLTCIRNAQRANHRRVEFISSKLKQEVARVLKEEGYIIDYSVTSLENNLQKMTIELKYFKNRPVIDKVKRVSRPGLRVYKSVKELEPVPGFGISILTTSKGVMTHAQAISHGIGGEVICDVA